MKNDEVVMPEILEIIQGDTANYGLAYKRAENTQHAVTEDGSDITLSLTLKVATANSSFLRAKHETKTFEVNLHTLDVEMRKNYSSMRSDYYNTHNHQRAARSPAAKAIYAVLHALSNESSSCHKALIAALKTILQDQNLDKPDNRSFASTVTGEAATSRRTQSSDESKRSEEETTTELTLTPDAFIFSEEDAARHAIIAAELSELPVFEPKLATPIVATSDDTQAPTDSPKYEIPSDIESFHSNQGTPKTTSPTKCNEAPEKNVDIVARHMQSHDFMSAAEVLAGIKDSTERSVIFSAYVLPEMHQLEENNNPQIIKEVFLAFCDRSELQEFQRFIIAEIQNHISALLLQGEFAKADEMKKTFDTILPKKIISLVTREDGETMLRSLHPFWQTATRKIIDTAKKNPFDKRNEHEPSAELLRLQRYNQYLQSIGKKSSPAKTAERNAIQKQQFGLFKKEEFFMRENLFAEELIAREQELIIPQIIALLDSFKIKIDTAQNEVIKNNKDLTSIYFILTRLKDLCYDNTLTVTAFSNALHELTGLESAIMGNKLVRLAQTVGATCSANSMFQKDPNKELAIQLFQEAKSAVTEAKRLWEIRESSVMRI
jgi:hypothetical protein